MRQWVNWRDDLSSATDLAKETPHWPTHIDDLDTADWPNELFASVVSRQHIPPGTGEIIHR